MPNVFLYHSAQRHGNALSLSTGTRTSGFDRPDLMRVHARPPQGIQRGRHLVWRDGRKQAAGRLRIIEELQDPGVDRGRRRNARAEMVFVCAAAARGASVV